MIEYYEAREIRDKKILPEETAYDIGWNQSVDSILDKKPVRAVPENAFITTKHLLERWIKETEKKRDLAIADHDISTAEIKRGELVSFKFALGIIEKLEEYGEEKKEKIACGDD